MPGADIPPTETARLRALRDLDVLDTPPEEALDRLARLAAMILRTPIAAVSLVDAEREWFKASYGVDTCQGPRDLAFCAHAILGDDVMVVEDAAADPRFSDNPQVAREDGIRFYAGAPLVADGHCVGVLCVKDRRPRRLSNDERHLLGELAKVVMSEMNSRLIAARAQGAVLAKSRFLTNIGHAICSPTTAILGFADLLPDMGPLQAEQAAAVRTIRRNGEDLLGVVNDILDFAKFEAGTMLCERRAVKPGVVLRGVAEALKSQADAKGLGLSFEWVGPAPGAILTNEARLKQVLATLVGNAIRFTRRGSVRVTACLDDSDLEAPMLDVSVADTGIGIAPSQLPGLFERFEQPGRAEGVGGIGLGLAISRKMAEILGGTVTVQSTPGAGSTFRLRVSAQAAVTPESERALREAAQAAAECRYTPAA